MEAIRFEALRRMANVATILPLIEVFHKLNCHTYEKRRTGRRRRKKERERRLERKKGENKENEKKEMGQEREKDRRGLKTPNIHGNFTLEPVIPM